MAYSKTEWKDRVVQKPLTYQVIDNPDGTITLGPQPGTVIEEGTPVNAANMNKIEHQLYLTGNLFTTGGSSSTYTLTLSDISSMADLVGVPIKVKFHVAGTSESSLKINSYGARYIKKPNGNNVTNLSASVYTLVWDGTNFILQGEGGEYGTATANRVLSPYTIGTENGLVAGTIPSKSSETFNPSQSTQTIPSGQYLSGTQTINPVVFDAAKVLNDTTIAGKMGTMPNNGKKTVNAYIGTGGSPATTNVYGYWEPGSVVMSYLNASNAPNIKSGVNIGTVIGTLRAWDGEKKWASGTTVPTYIGPVEGRHLIVTGLDFTPSKVFFWQVPTSGIYLNHGILSSTQDLPYNNGTWYGYTVRATSSSAYTMPVRVNGASLVTSGGFDVGVENGTYFWLAIE